MSESMVHRVARALFESATRHVFPDDKMAWEALPDQFKNNHRDSARAVITAMMEPTEAMLEAEVVAYNSAQRGQPTAMRCGHALWTAMIYAALKD